MSTTNIAQRLQLEKTWDEQLSITSMIILHLLPGALVMLLMIFASQLLEWFEIYPSVPVLFTFVAPALMLMQLGFLYHQGKRLNGKYSLQGIVLYRDHPMPWWKTVVLALPILAWIAFAFFVAKPPLNGFFVKHFFSWMPVNFLDEAFLNHLNQYSPAFLRVIGILFTLSITLGGAVEELYFRGYLLPRMESLGAWAPFLNVLLFSLYHFWSPWENVVRLLAHPQYLPGVVDLYRYQCVFRDQPVAPGSTLDLGLIAKYGIRHEKWLCNYQCLCGGCRKRHHPCFKDGIDRG